MDDCLACGLMTGRIPLPGGRIVETECWVVEHCVGSLNVGTLIIKPRRHVTAVADLTDDEAAELGPLLRRASDVAAQLVNADQVYNCLWSHAGKVPAHIHYVIQPVTRELMTTTGLNGPGLQVAMFQNGQSPAYGDIERVAEEARQLFTSGLPNQA
jgi:diadenosine tetraphosphate (Ap4A) HIT family hydrolase